MQEDENALLLDALASIGDLDFDADDESAAEKQVAVSPLAQKECGANAVAATGAFTEATDSTRSVLETAQIEPLASLTEGAAPKSSASPIKWPGLRAPPGKVTTQNVSRLRRRDEVMHLRDLVGTLEQRLARFARSSEDESKPQARESKELATLWAQVATRQYQRRQESEMENIKLRRLLKDHIQVGRSLERLLVTKRAAMESLEANEAVVKRIRRTDTNSWKHGSEFEELLRNCARQYGETAKVLAKFTDDVPVGNLINHRNVRLVHDPERGLMIEAKECRILPFSYEDTTNEVWRFDPLTRRTHGPNEYHDDHDSEDDGNTQKIQVNATLDDCGSRSKFTGKVARRRYTEVNRTLIMMAGVLEPSEITSVKMQGVHLRMSGWLIIEPLDTPVGTPAATKFTAYRVSIPEVDAKAHDHSRTVDTLTNFLINTMAVKLDARTQQLENRLFQRAFSRGCTRASVSI